MNLGAAWWGCHLCVGHTAVDAGLVELGNGTFAPAPPTALASPSSSLLSPPMEWPRISSTSHRFEILGMHKNNLSPLWSVFE